MQSIENKIKPQKVHALVKAINISKDELINYLRTINIEAKINTLLEADVVEKVYTHFKKDIEREDKRIQKSVKFAEDYHVEMTEAQEIKRLEEEKKRFIEEEKKKKEDELRLKKLVEEENRLKEEEKRKQEERAYQEREKKLKQEAEKEKELKLKNRKHKRDSADTGKSGIYKKKQTEKTISETTRTSKPGKPERKVAAKFPERKETPVNEKTGFKKEGEVQKPPQTHDRRRFGDKFRKKGVIEKVTIEDIKGSRKKGKPIPPVKEGEKKEPGSFMKAGLKSKIIEDRFLKDKKDKEKKRAETEIEKKKRVKLEKGHRAKEATQKEIEEAIRDTYQKIEEDSASSARKLLRKRKKRERIEEEKKIQELKEQTKNVLKVNEYLSTSELANLMGIDVNEIIKNCFKLGIMVSINQRLEKDIIELIASDFGFKIEFQKEYEEETLEEEPDNPEDLRERAPVVTVMGHVDHGKTSLLDHLRKANVVEGEAGGITQHIGAYKVKLDNGKEITFLDTPGHEAFTAMRARGGQAADIVVLVVAADDNVMPQTVEAINHARAANVPIVIAINKVDKPEANPDKIKQQLSEKDILVEEWGGKYQSVEISAKHGKNIETLLEKILVEAELLELKANPSKEARGVIIEAKLDKGRGPIATVLVQKGTLKVGDSFVSGIHSGKVKAMLDERDNKINAAKPSTPVVVLGFDGVPQAGDTFIVLESERDSKAISLKRQQLKREQDFRQVRFITLDDISKQIHAGQKQVELKIILKTDTDGSAEAIADAVHKLTSNETKVSVIHKAVGAINESDILLAEASGAIVIGFNVRPILNARRLAERHNIDVRIYNIIYKITDDIKNALEGMLSPELSEEITATVEIRQVYKVPKIGNVAGCYVLDGKITRNNKIRLLRDGFQIYEGSISSLKRHKDDAREVESGYECGIGIDGFNDIKVGDIIEGFKIIETKRKLVTG